MTNYHSLIKSVTTKKIIISDYSKEYKEFEENETANTYGP